MALFLCIEKRILLVELSALNNTQKEVFLMYKNYNMNQVVLSLDFAC